MPHSNKHIREAIDYAERHGWRFEKAGPRAHIYGSIYCPLGHGGCIRRVFSTPANPQKHADWLKNEVNKCSH